MSGSVVCLFVLNCLAGVVGDLFRVPRNKSARRFVPRNESTGSTRSQIRSKAAVLIRHWPNVSAYIIAYIFITCVE